MIPINNQMQIMNTLSSGISQDVLDLRAGKLEEKKANAISRLAQKAISAIAQGVMTANHQEIQREKIKVSMVNAQAKSDNVKIQKAKLKNKGIIVL
jgi:hypothetical protein